MSSFTVRIAATFTAEPTREALESLLEEVALPAEIRFSPFNQVFQELLSPGSSLEQNGRGLNVLLVRLEDLAGGADAVARVQSNGDELVAALHSAVPRFAVPTLLVFCPPSAIASADDALRAAIGEVERRLVPELAAIRGLHVVTSDSVAEGFTLGSYDNPIGHRLGAVPYTTRFFARVAYRVARAAFRVGAPPHKVIVLDCDNTLWSGIVGEEGVEGIAIEPPRRFLQDFMRQQGRSGMLLCLCSRNNEADVWEVFDRRPDMLLRREELVSWRINWERKSENLKSLARELQLGLDSFIFVDDDDAVCAEVRDGCPEVLTIRLPDDPALIPAFFIEHWAFDHLDVTAEDAKRTEMYRANAERARLSERVSSMEEFLRGLELVCRVEALTDEHVPRVAQLTQRTNQFNVSTKRRTELELAQFLREGGECRVVHVADKFGDYGLVGAMMFRQVAHELEVDSFLLSCRALGRGVEFRMLAELGEIAAGRDCTEVVVPFVPSRKNSPAREFLERTGEAFRIQHELGSSFRYPTAVARAIADEANLGTPVASLGDERSIAKPAVGADVEITWSKRHEGLYRIASTLNHPDALLARLAVPISRRETTSAAYAPASTPTERTLVELWERVLQVKPVGVDDDYFESGGDSLLAVSLFVEISERFARELPVATLYAAPTVRTLARVIESSPHPHERRYLVAIQPEGSHPPLFCFHAAGGQVLFYRDLALRLGPEQPVYGLQAREMPETGTYLDSVEAMAAEYVREIEELLPEGPYFLCGSSFGGLLAYEAAAQLHAKGRVVSLVALFDTYGPGYPARSRGNYLQRSAIVRFAHRLRVLQAQVARVEPGQRWTFLQDRARKLRDRLVRRWLWKRNEFDIQYKKALGRELPKDVQRNHKAIERALRNYRPRPLPVPLTVFRARTQPAGVEQDLTLGWKALAASGIEVIESAGTHGAMTVHPHSSELALRLQAVVSRQILGLDRCFNRRRDEAPSHSATNRTECLPR